MQQKTNSTTMLFISGLALGGILTALFTPNKGEDTRSMIKSKMDAARDRAKQSGQKKAEFAEEKVDQTKQIISKGKEKLKNNNNKNDDQTHVVL